MKEIKKDVKLPRLVLIGLLVLVAGVTPARAQSGNDLATQIWADVNPAYFIDPDLKVFGDIGARRKTGDDGWWRLVVRPSFRTKLGGRFYFTFGIGNFFTFNEVISDRWEFRPFQGLDFVWPRGRVPLRHYFRMEERYDYNLTTGDVKTSLRGRYKISVSYRFAARLHDRFWQATASAEVFATFDGEQGQMREQSRVTVGLDRSFSRDIHYRFELTWQQDGSVINADENVHNLYFRFRITKKWGHAQSLRKETSS